VTNAVLPLLKQAPAGRIVNVASQLGSLTLQAASELPTYLAYGSSKSALNAITVQYARELAGTSVRVNACSPGKCATDLNGFTSDRTPAQGARIIVDMATVDDRHGVYVTEDGPIPW
jgi:NAD(P)-dependent dehydrogenase (short-subunit alcohol dehydrogenase family)